jgi:anion-transporting  ArsA/GET3 family ATPase
MAAVSQAPAPLHRRLIFVVGKGGVGKSTISAGIGLLAARSGRRTVVAELGGAETMSALFDGQPVGYEGRELATNLRGMSITPAEAIEEYLVRMLRFRLLYDLVFRNRYIAPFMNGVMGLSDLISVGKVMDLEWERIDGSTGPEARGDHRFDLVVVDCPATGHGLSLLRAPQAMMDVTRVGPLHHNAQMIRDLLADHERCGVLLVTLPEEMPVAETIQLAASLRDHVDVEVLGVIVNAMPPLLFAEGGAEAWPAVREAGLARGGAAAAAVRDAERTLRDRERAEAHVRRLQDVVGLPVLEVPLLEHRDIDVSALEELGRALEAWA